VGGFDLPNVKEAIQHKPSIKVVRIFIKLIGTSLMDVVNALTFR
jgi:hypothetical protein